MATKVKLSEMVKINAIDFKTKQITESLEKMKLKRNFINFRNNFPKMIGDFDSFFFEKANQIKKNIEQTDFSAFSEEFELLDNLNELSKKDFIQFFSTLKNSNSNVIKHFYKTNFEFVNGKLSTVERATLTKEFKKEIEKLIAEKAISFEYEDSALEGYEKLIDENMIESNNVKLGKVTENTLLAKANKRKFMNLDEFSDSDKSNLKNSLQEKISVLISNIVNDKFEKQISDFELELKNTIKKVEQVSSLGENLIKILNNGFGISGLDLKMIDKNKIEELSRVLESNKQLNELIEILGRFAKAYSKMISQTLEYLPLTTGHKIQQPYKDEIVGISVGNDLERVLPIEISMFKRMKLKATFLLKFVEQKLLEFEFGSYTDEIVMELQESSNDDELSEPKGPFVIVVDSSGSMQGIPEMVAKAISLAALRIAIKDKRKLSIVNFSTVNYEMTFIPNEINLNKLLEFLSVSFGGGTDINAGLKPAIDRMKQSEWKNADMLIVSDFDLGDISKPILDEISELRSSNNRFHALIIENNLPNTDSLSVFDNKYFFDTKMWNTEDVIKKIDEIGGLHEFEKYETQFTD